MKQTLIFLPLLGLILNLTNLLLSIYYSDLSASLGWGCASIWCFNCLINEIKS